MNEVILLVDDDQAFRESVSEILDIEYYNVFEAKDGTDALVILENNNVDLVITDILMPEVEGNQLALKIKKAHPGLKIIGMTGGGRLVSTDMVLLTTSPDLFEVILRKPFSRDELLSVIKQNLNETTI